VRAHECPAWLRALLLPLPMIPSVILGCSGGASTLVKCLLVPFIGLWIVATLKLAFQREYSKSTASVRATAAARLRACGLPQNRLLRRVLQMTGLLLVCGWVLKGEADLSALVLSLLILGVSVMTQWIDDSPVGRD